MTRPASLNINRNKWFTVAAAALLLIAFFLPWLNWPGATVAGYDMPAQQLFKITEEKFDFANPFPEYNFANLVFWFIPVSALLVIIVALANRPLGWLPAIPGVLGLSLVTLYILITKSIIDNVGAITELLPTFAVGLYATVLAAIAIIVTGVPKGILIRLVLIVIGPLISWAAFTALSNKLNKEFVPEKEKSVYTISGLDLIREFQSNDSLANAKYREQIITVNGRVAAPEIINDSTVNLKVVDTTGSYVIFSFDKPYADQAKNIREGDSVSIKGSCSGGEYSDILGVHYITFKRSVLNK